jgi:hypothetical protein
VRPAIPDPAGQRLFDTILRHHPELASAELDAPESVPWADHAISRLRIPSENAAVDSDLTVDLGGEFSLCWLGLEFWDILGDDELVANRVDLAVDALDGLLSERLVAVVVTQGDVFITNGLAPSTEPLKWAQESVNRPSVRVSYRSWRGTFDGVQSLSQ